MNWKLAVLLSAWAIPFLTAQTTITEIKLHTDPADARIRPFEEVVVQVRVYGEIRGTTGRLRQDGATLEVLDAGGWISKPFIFQGADDETFIEQYGSLAGRIFGRATGEYVLQDSFLYTAPEEPGDYRVQATLEGKTATATIHVTRNAASRREPEKTDFPPEQFALDPYRDLVEHYSPLIAQETWFQPKSDYPTRFDFDDDWNGANNWETLEEGTSQAYVYYAVMETSTHWFLIYNVFHPRDYSDKCVIGTCHENDNEGLILTVSKDGGAYGRLQAMETLAHNNIYSFTADDSIRNGVHSIEGRIEFYNNSHPVVFVESGGHGIHGSRSSHSRYDFQKESFTSGTGTTFVYKGMAERPKHPNDRLVGYDLLPIYSHWWIRTDAGNPDSRSTFDDFFTYQPLGRRPGARFRSIGGAFLGKTEAENKAKPFWGWHDNRTKKRDVLAVGQWGLDPAYAVSRNLRFPSSQPFSMDYVFNPYLETSAVAQSSTRTQNPRNMPSSSSPTPATVSKGWFEFSVWIDGSVEAFIRSNNIRYQVLDGAPIRDSKIAFSEPMPFTPLRSLRVQKKQGRGNVQLLEQPSAQNGYTARLRIDDPRRSGVQYNILLEWER